MEILWLVTGVALGAVIGWFAAKSKNNNNNTDSSIAELQQKIYFKAEKNKMLVQELESIKPQLDVERTDNLELNKELSTIQADYKNLETRLKEQKAEVAELNQKFTSEFKNLANQIFEEKSKKFTDQNKSNIQDLLSPLKERIGEFQKESRRYE